MDDLLEDFLTETTESIATVDADLLVFEQNPQNQDTLNNIFRLLHTIKGTCGFLGLKKLEQVAHTAEDLLDSFRRGEVEVSTDAVSLVMESIDTIRTIVAVLQKTGKEPEDDFADFLERLRGAMDGVAKPETLSNEDLAVMPAPAPKPALAPDSISKTELVEAAPATPAEKEPQNKSIRVKLSVLENLMNQISELVLSRNQLMELYQHNDGAWLSPLQRLSAVTTSLQDGIMQTRMQSIGSAWAKFPRMVRDLTMQSGKKVDIVMHGEDTELDRRIVDLIRDPLTHLLRNAIDHGIELPTERLAAGKPETGNITINAWHEDRHIAIQIKDDGRGLNMAKIRRKVIESGLMLETDMDTMSEKKIQNFIFHPGFSTAQEITAISGRGVGMDVVRKNIENIGGVISIASKEGQGMVLNIKVPLTIAIISSLIIRCDGERYAIPQTNITEIVHTSLQTGIRIEKINDALVMRLRDNLVPLLSLHHVLGLNEKHNYSGMGDYIIIVQAGGQSFGIIVDQVFSTEEIVVKPIARVLHDTSLYAGNTLLGDGTVILILDTNRMAREITDFSDYSTMDSVDDTVVAGEDEESFLLFKMGNDSLKLLPLNMIDRLEKIHLHEVDTTHVGPVVQYGGVLMPLLGNVERIYDEQMQGESIAVIFNYNNKRFGLIIDEIVDIVHDAFHMDMQSEMPDILGSTIVAGNTCDAVDVSYYIRQLSLMEEGRASGDDQQASARGDIIIMDRSLLLRQTYKTLLSSYGYRVYVATNVDDVASYCHRGGTWAAVLASPDIQDTSVHELVDRLRSCPGLEETPLIALGENGTGHYTARLVDNGFDEVVDKFNRTEMVRIIQGHVGATVRE